MLFEVSGPSSQHKRDKQLTFIYICNIAKIASAFFSFVPNNQFSKMSKGKKLTDDQIEDLKGEFFNLDSDGDGVITVKELEAILCSMQNKLSCSEKDIQQLLKVIDVDGDGKIDLKEYHTIMKDKTNRDLIHRALVKRSSARKQFAKFDTDHSGYCSVEEIHEGYMKIMKCNVALAQVEKMVKHFDRNKDGKIDYEEFVLMMTK